MSAPTHRAKLITRSVPARRAAGAAVHANRSSDSARPSLGPAADSTNVPVAGCAAYLVGENRNLMPARAQEVRGDDQIALGAAAGAIETARQQRYSHRATLRRTRKDARPFAV